MDDPTAVRRALHDRHAERIASLLEHCQATLPDHAFSPADIKALRPAFDRWSDAQLATVWDWAQLSPEMELARRQGWSTSWASVANDRLPDRVRDARRWHERGRPIEAVTAKITGRRARASPTMNEALGFAPSAPSLFVKTELELALERAAAEDEALGNQRGFDYEPTPFEPMTSGYTGNGGRR